MVLFLALMEAWNKTSWSVLPFFKQIWQEAAEKFSVAVEGSQVFRSKCISELTIYSLETQLHCSGQGPFGRAWEEIRFIKRPTFVKHMSTQIGNYSRHILSGGLSYTYVSLTWLSRKIDF